MGARRAGVGAGAGFAWIGRGFGAVTIAGRFGTVWGDGRFRTGGRRIGAGAGEGTAIIGRGLGAVTMAGRAEVTGGFEKLGAGIVGVRGSGRAIGAVVMVGADVTGREGAGIVAGVGVGCRISSGGGPDTFAAGVVARVANGVSWPVRIAGAGVRPGNRGFTPRLGESSMGAGRTRPVSAGPCAGLGAIGAAPIGSDLRDCRVSGELRGTSADGVGWGLGLGVWRWTTSLEPSRVNESGLLECPEPRGRSLTETCGTSLREAFDTRSLGTPWLIMVWVLFAEIFTTVLFL